MLQECEAVIKFTIPKEKVDLLYDVTEALRKLGVTFDTGGGIDDDGNLCYDWEFDWSLKGPVKVCFKKMKHGDSKIGAILDEKDDIKEIENGVS
ncbi:hypothetical protein LCGC14_1310350 [marine sediment metagenome]|uniref:Uncharacterized protein n=1 Tax=marine sediment metagenome TaxID=412755 RepID=A0A0F9NQ15_9ZZZZ